MKNLKPILLTGILCLAFMPSTFSQVIKTVAGGNTMKGALAKDIWLDPYCITFDNAGQLYVGYDSYVWRAQGDRMYHYGGSGLTGNKGDGGPAIAARVSSVKDFCFDRNGNMYVVCYNGTVIRKIEPDGEISTFAGTGTLGFGGDGGPAIAASFDFISSICTDKKGNIYVTDENNSRIRRIDLNGIITTIAGNGIGGSTGDGGLATNATFSRPCGIAVDRHDNLYITDWSNYKIRKIDTAGIVTLIAGNGQFKESGDGGKAIDAGIGNVVEKVCIDEAGNVYIPIYRSIRKVDTAGIITTFAGSTANDAIDGDGIPAKTARLNVNYLTIGADGDFYFASSNRVRKIAADSNVYTVLQGKTSESFPAFPATSQHLRDVSLGYVNPEQDLIFGTVGIKKLKGDSITMISSVSSYESCEGPGGSVYCFKDAKIIRVDKDGVITTIAGTGNYGSEIADGVSAALVNFPANIKIAVDKDGSVFFSYSLQHTIWKIGIDGIIHKIAGNGDYSNSGDGGTALQAGIAVPEGLAVDQAGNLYVTGGWTIRKIKKDGIINTVAGNGSIVPGLDGIPAVSAFVHPRGVTIDKNGNIFFVDYFLYRGQTTAMNIPNHIRKIDKAGILTTIAGGGTDDGENVIASNAQIFADQNLAVDTSGNIYFSEHDNKRIRKIDFTTNYWTGAENMAWENPNNWSTHAVPNELTHVVINSGTVTVSSDAIARSLKLLPGVNFTVIAGGNLTVLY